MRRPAVYPAPSYHDANDRRLVEMIRKAEKPSPKAVNIVGIPYDGAVLGRKGAAGGPAAIRRSMGGFSNYNLELRQGLEKVRISDLGDLAIRSDEEVRRAHREIETEIAGDINSTSMLVVLGGDNSISLPALKACARRYGEIGLIVVDSHLDLRGRIGGRPTSGSSYGLAMEEISTLNPDRVVEIGVHGFLNSRKYYEKAKRLGVGMFSAGDVRAQGAAAVARSAYLRASKGADAVYLSVDLDSVDIGQVTGVSAPSAGGITTDELLAVVYEVASKPKVKAADIVELAPNLDPSEASQRVAATVLTYMIAGFGAR